MSWNLPYRSSRAPRVLALPRARGRTPVASLWNEKWDQNDWTLNVRRASYQFTLACVKPLAQ